MNSRFFRMVVQAGLLGGTILLFSGVHVGCRSQAADDEVARRGSNLQSLAGMYRMYTTENGGCPPSNEAEFKAFIQEQGLEHFESFGITTVDDLFISPRDGQPYIVVYGGGPEAMPDLVAYEREGLESGRWIVNSMTVVAEVDEAKFQRMVSEVANQ